MSNFPRLLLSEAYGIGSKSLHRLINFIISMVGLSSLYYVVKPHLFISFFLIFNNSYAIGA